MQGIKIRQFSSQAKIGEKRTLLEVEGEEEAEEEETDSPSADTAIPTVSPVERYPSHNAGGGEEEEEEEEEDSGVVASFFFPTKSPVDGTPVPTSIQLHICYIMA